MSNIGVNKVSIIIGKRGCGKTTFLKEKVIRSSVLPKTLIIDTFDSLTWHSMESHNFPNALGERIEEIKEEEIYFFRKGIKRMICPRPERSFDLLAEYLRNTLVIFEDSTRYLEGRLQESVRNFVLDTKQKNLNLVFVFHSLSDVPPRLIKYSQSITMFKTLDGSVDRNKYSNPQIQTMFDYLKNSKNEYDFLSVQTG